MDHLFLPLPFTLARKAYLQQAIRIQYGTAKLLASELGVTPATLSQVISGESRSARIEARLAEIAHIPSHLLFPGRERAA
ncbi:MAG: hypothetical protein AB1824_01400 [Acidobacteriota bacterium]